MDSPAAKKSTDATSGSSQIRLGLPDAFEEPASSQTCSDSAQALTLDSAIDAAFRQQPRLRVYLEGIEQARRRGGHRVRTVPSDGGDRIFGRWLRPERWRQNTALGPPPGFTFIPALGSIPIGLDINTGFELADLKLQWLICDFGRRLGRYRQAGLAVDIAQLQSERAFQTVASEVSVAYYQVLRTRALRKIALGALRRSEDDLDVAKKLEKGGALERE
jgi:outer membrane protein TolC